MLPIYELINFSDSSKRRKRYMYMRRKNIAASPKSNSAGKGQSKQASDSDAERARNKRRRRKSLRKINQSPSSDEAGQGNIFCTTIFCHWFYCESDLEEIQKKSLIKQNIH